MLASKWIAFTAGLVFSAAPSAIAQNPNRQEIRFQAMDQNGDNVITKREWRGSQGSFRLHDWNKDGVLSGDEVRPGVKGRGRGQAKRQADFDGVDREYQYDEWTAEGFRALDHNTDSRITADEWHFDRESFRRADHNRDNVISRAEFLSEDAVDDDRNDSFRDLDVNNDGRIGREEWHGSLAVFQALDNNRDSFVTRVEMTGEEPPSNLFASVDVNRDGRINLQEWHWSRVSFDRLDGNRDSQLSQDEFQGRSATAARSSAYRAGHERGLAEGRVAGREDRDRNQGWDLEGQRELVAADSGYEPRLGAKAEYQAGYRDAFRAAYREGWERR